MSKVLKIAAIVVGVAAIALTAGVALLGAPAVIGALGGLGLGTFTAAGFATFMTVLSVTASVLSLAAGVLARPPKLSSTGVGQQLDFRADPASGEPYPIGRAMIGEGVVHQASWGEKNRYLGIVGVLSICTLSAYTGLYADMTAVSFSGRNATGYFHDFMYLSTQLGTLPEGAALDMTAPDASLMPDWSSAHKLSGLGAAGLVLVADIKDGKIYSGGLPKLTHLVEGVAAYDARADSTQPGGSGAQRVLNESTYVYSENPWVHAETYALGRWQNDIRVIGPGLAPAQIDFAAFMEAATIADTNGWKASGLIMSTDRKWDVLKAMAQAGGGFPMPTGAHLSCLINAPKVSLETITEADVKGQVSAPQMRTRRDRLNGAIPRYRSADHGWEIVPGDAVRNATWVTADGVEATREVEFALVADVGDGAGKDQAAQLAAYFVANSRERGPITVELGYVWSQYRLGDCLTLDLPSANLINQKCVVIGRTINPAHNSVTLQFQTEDDAKHTWALGVAGAVSTPPVIAQPPGTGDVLAETDADVMAKILGSTVSGLTFSVDSTGAAAISTHLRIYSDRTVTVVGGTAPAPAGVTTGDVVAVYYGNEERGPSPVAPVYFSLRLQAGDELPSPSSFFPDLHMVGAAVVPASGTTTAGSAIGTSDPGTGIGGIGGGWKFDTP